MRERLAPHGEKGANDEKISSHFDLASPSDGLPEGAWGFRPHPCAHAHPYPDGDRYPNARAHAHPDGDRYPNTRALFYGH